MLIIGASDGVLKPILKDEQKKRTVFGKGQDQSGA
jgi:hypothetical protein